MASLPNSLIKPWDQLKYYNEIYNTFNVVDLSLYYNELEESRSRASLLQAGEIQAELASMNLDDGGPLISCGNSSTANGTNTRDVMMTFS